MHYITVLIFCDSAPNNRMNNNFLTFILQYESKEYIYEAGTDLSLKVK
jgi:hypothetical protein